MRFHEIGWLAAGPILHLLLTAGGGLAATESPGDSDNATQGAVEVATLDDKAPKSLPLFGRGSGISFGREDGKLYARAWLRAQLRYSDPFDSDPRTLAAMQSPPGSEFELRRSRIKLEGHLFDPRIAFYAEKELRGDRPLLDLRLDVTLRDDLRFRIGQFKALYNGYAQAGKAWPVDFGRYTFPVQIAARFARVDWDDTPADRTQTEYTLAANLFLAGHENKFTADLSLLDISQPGIGGDDDIRFRLQWDVSF